MTRDVDLTVLLAGFGSEDRLIAPLLAAYPARIEDAGEFALGIESFCFRQNQA